MWLASFLLTLSLLISFMNLVEGFVKSMASNLLVCVEASHSFVHLFFSTSFLCCLRAALLCFSSFHWNGGSSFLSEEWPSATYHEPRYWSATDQYKATLLQGKQAQDAPLWFPYRFRAGQTVGKSRGHCLVQVPECGNKSNQACESCTTIRQSGDQITQEKWYDFQEN